MFDSIIKEKSLDENSNLEAESDALKAAFTTNYEKFCKDIENNYNKPWGNHLILDILSNYFGVNVLLHVIDRAPYSPCHKKIAFSLTEDLSTIQLLANHSVIEKATDSDQYYYVFSDEVEMLSRLGKLVTENTIKEEQKDKIFND